MSTLSLRKIKHDSSSVDNITLNSNGTTTANAEVIVPSLKGASGNKLQLRSGDSSYGVSLQNISGIDLLSVDAVGRVTKPYHPAFRATNNNTNQPLTANTETLVQYNTAETNIGSNYNTSTYRFTAPVSGFYHFSASILVSKATSTRIDIMFKKNGSYWVSGELQALSSGSTNCLIANSMDGYLSTGDYVDVWTRINDNGSIYQEPKFWNFSGFLVG